MAIYITLMKWTEEGIKNIKQSPERLDAAKQIVKDAGGIWKDFYMVMGEYDLVAITEAPNDEAYVRIILSIGAGGAVRTTSLKAFGEEEYRRIIAALGPQDVPPPRSEETEETRP